MASGETDPKPRIGTGMGDHGGGKTYKGWLGIQRPIGASTGSLTLQTNSTLLRVPSSDFESGFRWVDVWAELEETAFDSTLTLYFECQDGLLDQQSAAIQRLGEVTEELKAIAEEEDAGGVPETEYERHDREEKVRLLRMELRSLQGKVAALSRQMRTWKKIPIGSSTTVSASSDREGLQIEVHTRLEGKSVKMKARTTEARNQLLSRVRDVGIRLGLSRLIMCEQEVGFGGPGEESNMSIQRNRRHDPRNKLWGKAIEAPQLQPPSEAWATAPLATYGSMRWQEAKQVREEEEAERKKQPKVELDRMTGEPVRAADATSMIASIHWHRRDLLAVPESLWKIPQYKELQHCYLEHNKIPSLPEQMQGFPWLRILSLGTNLLTEVPSWIDRLTCLESLNLSNNKIRTFTKEIGHVTTLTSLNLFSNLCQRIPTTLGACTGLTMLNLGRNHWETWAGPESEMASNALATTTEAFVEPEFLELPESLIALIRSNKIPPATRETKEYLKRRIQGFEEEKRVREERRLSEEEAARQAMFMSDAFLRRKEELRKQQEMLLKMEQERMEAKGR
uniref:Uncharacterized protein n=1 Tax=Hemiselmis andersenii TaxID=464988 RepID=A0A6U4ZT83_HEMAN|mmetsp:Transcript_15909/g.36745  ORF Transcript_15909/g.36745 Transcript_15909/m.36745 type:complete len:566 (-) Transcript_15909:64-1761(-)